MGVFRFKQFSVCDDRVTMKVGTDAVLLGAWTDVEHIKTILDIGTGSGIIALMLAQRSSPETKIDAVELLEEDANQASANVFSSPWPHKISIFHTSIQKFDPSLKYDRIVCNPPFFSKSLLPPSIERSNVRHDVQLPFADLITTTIRLLTATGKFSLILPTEESELFTSQAVAQRLFLQRLTRFFTRAGKRQERSLMEFGFTEMPPEENSLTLYSSGDVWTDEYQRLTKDFYLDR